MTDVAVPQLGESVTEGTITKWLVKEGDIVVKDQPIAEIATDKADSELPAPTGGRVTKLLANEGDVVPVKTVICQIDESAAGAAPTPAAPAASAAPAAAPVNASSPLAAPSTRRAALEQGVDLKDVRGSGEHGRITRDDVTRAAGGNDAPVPPPPPRQQSQPEPQRIVSRGGDVPAVQALVNQGGWTPPVPGKGYGSFKLPAYREKPGDKIVPFSRRRRITADHMTYSKQTSPHVMTVAECDLYAASKLREANKDRYKKEGLSLTMLAFVTVAVARAVRENPTLNARVLDDAYVVHKEVNLGVAVDSPDGLVVPVVRRADELGLRGIVRSIDDLATRAKSGKITIDDLSGATFSISNPGLKGNLFGAAIINQPNVGILRMGEIKKRVVVVEGPSKEDQMAIHPVMYMALSYDHRIVDGVAANAFLWRVRELLEKADFEV